MEMKISISGWFSKFVEIYYRFRQLIFYFAIDLTFPNFNCIFRRNDERAYFDEREREYDAHHCFGTFKIIINYEIIFPERLFIILDNFYQRIN